jgi:ElaB/YqjD/DUF883 family membrane-anchored ribosome-binding protein
MFARMTSRRSQARRAARVLHQQPVQVVGEELRILISRVEDLVGRLGEAADPELRRLRKQAEVALSNVKAAIGEGGSQLGDQVRELAEHGQKYVRRRPLTSLGLVALGMLAIGLWTSRSMMSD